MTCTFCGSLLDGTESECPFCGHKLNNDFDAAPVEPRKSQSAADFLSKFAADSSKNTSDEYEYDYDEYEEEDETPKRKSKKSKGITSIKNSSGVNPSMLLMIALVASLIVSFVTMCVCISVNSKVSDLKQDMLSQLYQLQTSQSDISNNLNSVSSTVGSIGTSIEQQNLSKNITITKQPTEAITYVGRGAANTEGETLNQLMFSIAAEGSNLTFTWQKFDNNSGEWINMTFDPNTSNNEDYGLHVYNTSNESQIAACGLTELAFGTYRCVISDSSGVQYSDVVTLTQKSK